MKRQSLAERVASNVRAEMARNGVTQTALAGKLHRTQQYVSRRISGNIPFDLAELDEIAQVIGCPVSNLLNEAVPA